MTLNFELDLHRVKTNRSFNAKVIVRTYTDTQTGPIAPL